MPQPAKSPVPEGFPTATPHLVVSDSAAAIDFYKRAFGAVEHMRLPGPDGRMMHACIQVGNSPIMMADEFPEYGGIGPATLKGTSVSIHLCVPDADAMFAQAVKAGATVIMPLDDAFWGDRYGLVEDPFGHRWAIASRKYDLTPAEIAENMKANMPAS